MYRQPGMPLHVEMAAVLLNEAGPTPWLPVSPSRGAGGSTSGGAGGGRRRASEDRKRHHQGGLAQEAEILAVRGRTTDAERQLRALLRAASH